MAAGNPQDSTKVVRRTVVNLLIINALGAALAVYLLSTRYLSKIALANAKHFEQLALELKKMPPERALQIVIDGERGSKALAITWASLIDYLTLFLLVLTLLNTTLLIVAWWRIRSKPS